MTYFICIGNAPSSIELRGKVVTMMVTIEWLPCWQFIITMCLSGYVVVAATKHRVAAGLPAFCSACFIAVESRWRHSIITRLVCNTHTAWCHDTFLPGTCCLYGVEM